jgi:hypothetical protein
VLEDDSDDALLAVQTIDVVSARRILLSSAKVGATPYYAGAGAEPAYAVRRFRGTAIASIPDRWTEAG